MTRRRPTIAVMTVLLASLLAGCALPPPPGSAPLRYRDAVFGSVAVQQGLTYGSAPDLQGNPVQLQLDLYEPAGDTAARRPAVIWVHGGGFWRGSRLNEKIVDLSNTYARLGYVSVAISYRLLAPPTCADDPGDPRCAVAAIAAKHDAQAAVRWLRSRASALRVDPERIAIGGFSAGGIAALLAAVNSEDVGSSGNPGFSSKVQGAVVNCGGLADNALINAGDAPTVYFHGSADRTVPPAWSQSNHQAMLAAGVPTHRIVFQGEGHCPNWERTRQTTVDQSKYFLYYMMGLPG